MAVDFTVRLQGSVWQFVPVSQRAKNFAETDLGLEDWQWMGNTFCIDARPAFDLVHALRDEGFVVEGDY